MARSCCACSCELGLHVWFRYEKYREEFAHEDVIVAIDETPVGVFVEIEGSEQGIATMAERWGGSQSDYIQDSYRGLFLRLREELRTLRARHGVPRIGWRRLSAASRARCS